jgi:hypothetical protein
MTQQQESDDAAKQLDNARVGYQVATGLWIYEGGLIWSKFNALLVANSIVIAAIVVIMTVADSASPLVVGGFSILMSIVGFSLCLLWIAITERSFTFHNLWVLSARKTEEQFLKNAVTTVTRGGALADGNEVKFSIGEPPEERSVSLGRRALRVETATYRIIYLFMGLYVVLFIGGAIVFLGQWK